MEDTTTAITAALDQVGPRLKQLRTRRRVTLTDLVVGAGDVAQFDTRVPHWFGSTGDQPAEILSMFGPQRKRARPSKDCRQESSRGMRMA
ncbi:MAG: cupin domain-containing protein [Propionibacteriaceae bacterium]